jgi:UDP-GlcNAc3NAcA epimerase
MNLKILSVVGARPQFIKVAAVSRALARAGGVREVLVHTGQHFDDNMSDVFFRELELRAPDHHLGIGNLPQGAMTGRMLESVERVLLAEAPDWVMVYGDTNSTLAGALASAKLHIPLAHVEAGLRSFNRRMPEEINRVVTDHVSSALFAPTRTAVAHLAAEGVPADSVHLVGDVMYDAALVYGRIAEARSGILRSLGLTAGGYALATIHRAENTDSAERLRQIGRGLAGMAATLPVVLPLHPRTRSALERAGIALRGQPGLTVCDPVGYLDMTMLEKNAALVVTDSGGVQKEAYFHGVPCVTVREETEWTELVELGWNRITPPGEFASPRPALEWAMARRARKDGEAVHPYGRGDAGEKIAAVLLRPARPTEVAAR